MKLLFEMDKKNYKIDGEVFSRPSVRAIIINDNKIAMVYSKKYNYYKFPGGGINKGEDNMDALIREVKEETGLIVKRDTIKEYGYVIRKEKGDFTDIFLQENYYYLCDVEKEVGLQHLDDYEFEEGFSLRWVRPDVAIDINLNHDHYGFYDLNILTRDSKILEILRDSKVINLLF